MKKKTPAKAAPKKAAAKKPAPKPAAKKATPKARPKPAPQAKSAVVLPGAQTEQHKPGVHMPSRPAPAYSQMIQRGWAGKPPPHKISK